MENFDQLLNKIERADKRVRNMLWITVVVILLVIFAAIIYINIYQKELRKSFTERDEKIVNLLDSLDRDINEFNSYGNLINSSVLDSNQIEYLEKSLDSLFDSKIFPKLERLTEAGTNSLVDPMGLNEKIVANYEDVIESVWEKVRLRKRMIGIPENEGSSKELEQRLEKALQEINEAKINEKTILKELVQQESENIYLKTQLTAKSKDVLAGLQRDYKNLKRIKEDLQVKNASLEVQIVDQRFTIEKKKANILEICDDIMGNIIPEMSSSSFFTNRQRSQEIRERLRSKIEELKKQAIEMD